MNDIDRFVEQPHATSRHETMELSTATANVDSKCSTATASVGSESSAADVGSDASRTGRSLKTSLVCAGSSRDKAQTVYLIVFTRKAERWCWL